VREENETKHREAARNFFEKMAYSFFRIPCGPESGAADELNLFLRSHSILAVHREWVENGDASFWAFCVQFQDAAMPFAKSSRVGPKIDYKEILTEAQFTLYVKLRDKRKQIAERDGLPVFAVFTNEQLAAMATGPARTAADLKSIPGIGEGRVEKFGTEILAAIKDHAPGETAL